MQKLWVGVAVELIAVALIVVDVQARHIAFENEIKVQ